MKRDLDLVREILFAWEKSPKAVFSDGQWPEISHHEDKEVRYHIMIMVQAGLIHLEPARSLQPLAPTSNNSPRFHYQGSSTYSISWQGHEFLSALRDDTIWNDVKQKMTKAGGIAVDIAIELGKEMIKQAAFKLLTP